MLKFLLILSLPVILFSCASYDKFRAITEDFKIPSKVYDADFYKTWIAVIQVMKRYDLEEQNQEAGVIKTRWMDNTVEVNFADSFGSSDSVKSARVRLILTVTRGFRLGTEVSKVTVQKRQLIENDFLQGYKELATDGILEQTILYRIERIIAIDKKIMEIDKKREAEQIESF